MNKALLILGIAFSLHGIHSLKADTSHRSIVIASDIGGVLMRSNYITFVGGKGLGWETTIKNAFRLYKIYPTFLDALDRAAGVKGNPYGLKDPLGNSSPLLWTDYFLGKKTGKEVLAIVTPLFESHPEWFLHKNGSPSKNKQKLIIAFAKNIFLVEKSVTYKKKIKKMENLISGLKEKGHPLYIISNIGDTEYDAVEAKYPQLFSQFDGIIASAKVGHAKPNKDIFDDVEECASRNPAIHNPLFILLDDQDENIKAANALENWVGVPIKNEGHKGDTKRVWQVIAELEQKYNTSEQR